MLKKWSRKCTLASVSLIYQWLTTPAQARECFRVLISPEILQSTRELLSQRPGNCYFCVSTKREATARVLERGARHFAGTWRNGPTADRLTRHCLNLLTRMHTVSPRSDALLFDKPRLTARSIPSSSLPSNRCNFFPLSR